MKICHITTMHRVFDTRIFKKECVSLVKAGYDVTLIAAHDREEIVEGVRIVPVLKHRNFWERIVTAPKDAIRIAKTIDADLYHFHDPELVPYMANFAKKTGRKVVWDAHENYRDTIKNFNSLKIQIVSSIGAIFFNMLEMYVAQRNFTGVVTITDKMAEKYKKKNIKTCVLGNYADIEKFEYKGNQSQLTARPSLISSGTQFRARSVVEIAQSYAYIKKELNNAKIIFCGRFSENGLQDEISAILRMENEESKEIQGEVTFDYLINKAIPRAWVGTVLFDISDPNNRNGLPNRFFECWANGLPVIATRDTQVAKLVKEVNGGVVIDNNSPQAIASAFISIVQSRGVRDEMSVNAFRAVREKYNWNVNFLDLLLFYNEILEIN